MRRHSSAVSSVPISFLLIVLSMVVSLLCALLTYVRNLTPCLLFAGARRAALSPYLPLFSVLCPCFICHVTAGVVTLLPLFLSCHGGSDRGLVVSISAPFLCAPVVCCRAFVVSISAFFFVSTFRFVVTISALFFRAFCVSAPDLLSAYLPHSTEKHGVSLLPLFLADALSVLWFLCHLIAPFSVLVAVVWQEAYPCLCQLIDTVWWAAYPCSCQYIFHIFLHFVSAYVCHYFRPMRDVRLPVIADQSTLCPSFVFYDTFFMLWDGCVAGFGMLWKVNSVLLKGKSVL